jgi:hypothetical protein
MNSLYIIRSILECADRKPICEQSGQRVCNLEPSAATVVLILSILTSAASLGYKAARNVRHMFCRRASLPEQPC